MISSEDSREKNVTEGEKENKNVTDRELGLLMAGVA